MAPKKEVRSTVPTTTPEAAFLAFEAQLRAMKTTELSPLNVLLELAATVALRVHGVAAEPKFYARLKRLPAEEFDLEAVDRLALVARAIQYITARQATAEAMTTDALVSPRVVAEATDVKQRMLKVLEYNLEDEEALRDVAHIRSGLGYLDLAQDLRRLASLYGDWRELLTKDTRHYRATDAAEAARLADAISPRDPSGTVREWADLGQRAWTQLERDYDEVRETALWLLRKHKDKQLAFPNLIGASRRPGAGEKDKPADAPAQPVER